MSRRFVPRLERLESRQVLDAMPGWTVGPPSPSGALVGVAASPSPDDPISPDTPAAAAATAPLAASLPDPVPAVDATATPPTVPLAASLPDPVPALAIPPPLAEPLAPPISGPAKSPTSSPAELPAAKEPVSNSASIDLPVSSAEAATSSKHDEVAATLVDAVPVKVVPMGRSHAGPQGPRWLGTPGPLPSNADAFHSLTAPRDGVPEPAHAYGPASSGPDLHASPEGNHPSIRTHHALHPMILPQLGGVRPGPALVLGGTGEDNPSSPGKGGSTVAEAAVEGSAAYLTPARLDELFLQAWNAPAVQGSVPPPGQLASDCSSSRGGGGTGLPPLYLGVLPLPTGKPLDPVAAGYRYLCNYGRTAIYRAERRAGPLTDHEDIIQQICLEWLQQVGPPHEAFPRLLEHAAVEMQVLRMTVNRVISRVIYQQRKDRRCGELVDWPAPTRAAERDWVEFHSDCAQGVGHLSRLEWHILEQRRQGKTFAEIGAELGVARQRVWEVYQEVETRLRRIYSDSGG